MVDRVHRSLTGADLHEPKGADTALAGTIYVANGSGSGSWVAASSVVLNQAWSTGDMKVTYKVVPDAGWIFTFNDGTIGDSSSGSTVRANADTWPLFKLLWEAMSGSIAPVFTSAGSPVSRGPDAATDYNAHRRLRIPDLTQRVLGVAGSSNPGLSARLLGATTGVENVTLTTSQIPPVTPSGTVDITHSHLMGGRGQGLAVSTGTGIDVIRINSGDNADTGNVLPHSGPTAVRTLTMNPLGYTAGPHTNMQPTTFVNIMIKL